MLSYDALSVLWFILWAVLWIVYFTLDGYTLGVGILFPFLRKNEREEAQLQEVVGPFWNGNEVWLITAGGATFAAFPLVYAEMFSTLYVPLFLILFGLFYRATGLEFMSKGSGRFWKASWTFAFFGGSLAVALLLGVAFANMFYGLAFDRTTNAVTLASLLNPYGILGGLLFVAFAVLSGSLWTAHKVSGPLHDRARSVAGWAWFVVLGLHGLFLSATANRTTILDNYNAYPILYVVPALALLLLLLVRFFYARGRLLWSFLMTSGAIALTTATGFIGMFPRMLISRLDPAASITLYEARASELTLSIMLFVAVIFVPIVIGYQLWAYRLFRAKIRPEEAKGYR
ncbi:MAG: Cytochrome bd ubiquinol oxidase subunit II [Hydrogenibacillus schlegelii]|uniref:Cytochrome bd ubiquinol oxidase subunit II n=1 Tax=Hydrogenibacillus schlegelii TaxID=1484 RepID=A0A2T5GBI9_HYDSH|nr:cytochrome d ubiquinol oxidase subunit II [Hydrogenibacillus schlegelii]PTQ53551.1 MAG: Cytochrome bd ubiquinol oxidase subunit II [Hydrogenibacillus schlegelii]